LNRILILTCLLLVTKAIAYPIEGGASAGQSRSTVNNVFSPDQAVRGKRAYLANCSLGCHSPTLTGGERAPTLAGDDFLGRWRGRTLEELFIRIKSTMPQTKPQSLSDDLYIDIVAFLLDANGMPSGITDLRADPVTLKMITINDTH
jgi:Cytochrome C oxidase, cbb3-type, subunit III